MSLYVDIRKKYKGFTLEVAFSSGDETLALLGASGSGKSMTLKCIAGLISPDEGVIRADGRVLFDSASKIDLKPQARGVGYLFQSYALFPNMTVRQNIAIAWRPDAEGRTGAAGRDAKITELLARYELDGLGDRYPIQLSGGQQQRAALARIFAYQPRVLLLDEPFSALDAFLRENMQAELKRILREYDGSVVLVTHSRDEAYKIAEDLVILDGGKPVAAGSVREVFARPCNARAARITGCKNISAIEKTGERRFYAKDWGIELEAAESILENHTFAGIRAHDFKSASAGIQRTVPAVPETGGMVNTFWVDIVDEIDGPFEKDIIVRPALEKGGGGKLWWITEKNMDVSGSRALYIAPESIMLLEA